MSFARRRFPVKRVESVIVGHTLLAGKTQLGSNPRQVSQTASFSAHLLPRRGGQEGRSRDACLLGGLVDGLEQPGIDGQVGTHRMAALDDDGNLGGQIAFAELGLGVGNDLR